MWIAIFHLPESQSVLRSVAILYRANRRRAVTEAEWLANTLGEKGVEAVVGDGWDANAVNDLCCGRELVVTFGGDGTILHVARLASVYGVPLLGVNLGRVGFLAELTPEALRKNVDALVQCRYWIEERTMLDADLRVGGAEYRLPCLNEVTVARGIVPRAVQIRVMLDGEDFVTFTADGVVVATATGSTAYSLAAGGPILYPESRDILVTPVAPHLHIGRSIVVPGDTTVRLTLAAPRAVVVSVDGSADHPLGMDDVVEISRSSRVARFARMGPRRYFYSAISDRLK